MKNVYETMTDFRHTGKTAMSGQKVNFLIFPETISEEKTEFELSGLDAGELEMMCGRERRKVIREAGLNPDEYDF